MTAFSKWTSSAFGLALFFLTQQVFAIVTVPPGLQVGDQYRLMFVTSTTIAASLSNISDYNAHTQAAASAVPALSALGTTWNAAASTNTVDARDNTSTNFTLTTGFPIYRLDGVLIANDNSDLWDNSLVSPVNVTELGTISTLLAWTGTNGVGVKDPFNLYLGSATGVEYGSASAVDGYWIGAGYTTDNSELKPLYAISEVLTVRVPEPWSLGLLALSALVPWRVRKRER